MVLSLLNVTKLPLYHQTLSAFSLINRMLLVIFFVGECSFGSVLDTFFYLACGSPTSSGSTDKLIEVNMPLI